jgi:hypothetical protein
MVVPPPRAHVFCSNTCAPQNGPARGEILALPTLAKMGLITGVSIKGTLPERKIFTSTPARLLDNVMQELQHAQHPGEHRQRIELKQHHGLM